MVSLTHDIVPFRHKPKPSDTTAYVGMVIFLGGWAMMFAGLFFAYAMVRVKAESWPPPGENALPVVLPLINTLVLIASSVTLSLALKSVRSARPQALKIYLF